MFADDTLEIVRDELLDGHLEEARGSRRRRGATTPERDDEFAGEIRPRRRPARTMRPARR